jgi:uncharacterized protein YbjT (DUF2867 family)
VDISKGNKTALLFGATGLIGSHVLEQLLFDQAYAKVRTFSRKKLNLQNPKLEQHILDFDKMGDYSHLMTGDDLYLCLGTTMAKAKSKAVFRRIDLEYPLAAARIAVANGANQALLVSSVGASTQSLFFYLQVKGELEDSLRSLPFWGVHIFRPSFLLGERNENRFGEEVAGKIGRALDLVTGGLLMKYRPVEADIVAKAMVAAAQRFEPGIHIYPSHFLQKLANEADQEFRRLPG